MQIQPTTINLPKDGNLNPLQNFPPAVLSVQVNTLTGTSAATVVALATSATYIEVSPVTQGAYMRWGAVATTTTFDEFIQAGITRYYLVPQNIAKSVSFLQQFSTGTLVYVQK